MANFVCQLQLAKKNANKKNVKNKYEDETGCFLSVIFPLANLHSRIIFIHACDP